MFRGFATISFYADDLSAAKDWYSELLSREPYYAFPPPPRGAGVYEPMTEREAGFTTASVVDPFGNILGIMHNPHFLQMLATRKKA